MTVAWQPVMLRLAPAQALRMEALGKCYCPAETLESSELERRLLLEYLLWKGEEKGLVETVREPSALAGSVA
jgi:hypothetical protein